MMEQPNNPGAAAAGRRTISGALRAIPALAGLTLLLVAVHGFHYGIEDEGIYLPAVKHILNPALFPHDGRLISAQASMTLFPWFMATLAKVTGLPLQALFLAGYCAVMFLFVTALWLVAQSLFPEGPVRRHALLAVLPMLTMPVAGTALFMMDQHLHPRNVATALLLLALAAGLRNRWGAAFALGAAAFAIHPLVALFGGALLVTLRWKAWRFYFGCLAVALLAAAVFLRPAEPAWREAMGNHAYYAVTNWAWYEWLGAIGPMLILAALGVWARLRGLGQLGDLCRGLALYSVLFTAAAIAIGAFPRLERLLPAQPMRHLQFVYILMFFMLGGLLATQFSLFRRRGWPAYAALSVVFFLAQRAEFPASRHLEWPGLAPSNGWAEAFQWIAAHTAVDAYFALNPRYMELPGEDFHGFRALAERSMLADDVSDRSVATISPAQAGVWHEQSAARRDWDRITAEGLEGLRGQFGVDWVVLEAGHPLAGSGLPCAYRNAAVTVCRIP